MASTNITQFQAGIQAFVQNTEVVRRQRVRAVGLRALRGVVLKTRVDTGRLRGNWQVGETDPPEGEIDRADRAGSEGTADTVSAEAPKILEASGDDVIWLHNGLPYAVVWEREDKMVAGTVEALRTWLRSQ